jgi:hypothetical protein
VAKALNAGESSRRAMPPLVDGQTRDEMGRNWDVIVPARTAAQRATIDAVRDLDDLM